MLHYSRIFWPWVLLTESFLTNFLVKSFDSKKFKVWPLRAVGTGGAKGLKPHQYFWKKKPHFNLAANGFRTEGRMAMQKNFSPTNILVLSIGTLGVSVTKIDYWHFCSSNWNWSKSLVFEQPNWIVGTRREEQLHRGESWNSNACRWIKIQCSMLFSLTSVLYHVCSMSWEECAVDFQSQQSKSRLDAHAEVNCAPAFRSAEGCFSAVQSLAAQLGAIQLTMAVFVPNPLRPTNVT